MQINYRKIQPPESRRSCRTQQRAWNKIEGWKMQVASPIVLRGLVICFLMALIASFALFGFVVATGQTFGQRAAKKYDWGSEQWSNEVQRLAHESR